jgi:hypothetical protein
MQTLFCVSCDVISGRTEPLCLFRLQHFPAFRVTVEMSQTITYQRPVAQLPPTSFVRSGRHETRVVETVTGPDRHKFFSRPLVGNTDIASINEEKVK